MSSATKHASPLWVIIAFAIVYVVWGSTYFFIQMAINGFPPFLMGAVRFIIAGSIMLSICALKGDKLWIQKDVGVAAYSGCLMLVVSMGIVIWAERTLPSAMVAIVIAISPLWFVILDKPNWKTNFTTRSTIWGLIIGFAGVLLLFGEAIAASLEGDFSNEQLISLVLLIFGPAAWAWGGLYAKRRPGTGPARVTTAWQMMAAGIAYVPVSAIHNEFAGFNPATVPAHAWLAIAYLIVFGSIIAFTAYVWLLSVRPATQVSTHAYVNPVIAVVLGVFIGNEVISWLKILGLAVILLSVLLINYRQYAKK
ncbi:drug/metabolite transporter (DMT)-like permease [Mucilaginibacter auburnensis]|uniref:Drug/metabolite transporter (DMT)-like permease n=2 Tax=Mucilaginibacter auburnensis TaxID=1457233 RepID=A0A2H9VP53_9SPHI|nr:drug/metabolite transporter (DMT)-like permease [Mucilaginibacter auburnensis]